MTRVFLLLLAAVAVHRANAIHNHKKELVMSGSQFQTPSLPIEMYACNDTSLLTKECPLFFENACHYPLHGNLPNGDQPLIEDEVCFCDDSCLGKYTGMYAGIMIGVIVLAVIGCTTARGCHPITDERIQEALATQPKSPHPGVSKGWFKFFRILPFSIMFVISVWFLCHTIAVILALGGSTSFQTSVMVFSYLALATMFMVFYLFSTGLLFIHAIRGLHLTSKTIKEPPAKHTDTVQHFVVLPNYKEDEAMLEATITKLAFQANVDCKQNVTIVLAMEEAEEDWQQKGARLRDVCKEFFKDILITAHPKGVEGEQPGKSSNMVSAWRFLNENGYVTEPDRTVVTLMDADALAHINFLSALSHKFENAEKRAAADQHMLFWQCPVAFYQNLDEVDFINRASAIIFAFNEFANAGGFIDLGIVGYNPRMPVNTYSMSWRLWSLISGGDPFVVADEGHNLIKAFFSTKGIAKIEPIFLPISVYSVTNDNFLTGFHNRYKQVVRWVYGNGYAFAFWYARFLKNRNGIFKSHAAPFLWRLLIFGSVNLVQPLFFCLYGFLWAFTINNDYFQKIAMVLVTVIMTTFLIINFGMVSMHWKMVEVLEIKGIMEWPLWKKICLTLFDAVLGVGCATVFFIYIAGFNANWDLMVGKGLKWGTEGRAAVKEVDSMPKSEFADDSLPHDLPIPPRNQSVPMSKLTVENSLYVTQSLRRRYATTNTDIEKDIVSAT